MLGTVGSLVRDMLNLWATVWEAVLTSSPHCVPLWASDGKPKKTVNLPEERRLRTLAYICCSGGCPHYFNGPGSDKVVAEVESKPAVALAFACGHRSGWKLVTLTT